MDKEKSSIKRTGIGICIILFLVIMLVFVVHDMSTKEKVQKGRIVKVDSVEPVESGEIEVKVNEKNIFLVENSVYAYSLNLIFPIEGNEFLPVDYMCSVSTWKSVNEGDYLNVKYGTDERGRIIIYSLSKLDY